MISVIATCDADAPGHKGWQAVTFNSPAGDPLKRFTDLGWAFHRDSEGNITKAVCPACREEQMAQDAMRSLEMGNGMIVWHKHFWVMAQEIRDYCRDTGVHVISMNYRDERAIGFLTVLPDSALPEGDLRLRLWKIRLADVSRTANKRSVGYDGLSEFEMTRITHPYLMNPGGRAVVAKTLSTGALP
jgi:hypothetical protein